MLLEWQDVPVIALQGFVENSENQILDVPCITHENKEVLTTKAAKMFLKEFDQIISEVNGSIWYRDFVFDGKLSTLSKHLLLKGATSTPFFSRVIDLYNDEKDLKKRIRRSYKSIINWGTRTLKPRVYGKYDLSWENMLTFRELHIKESRETRSETSWRRQYELVESGEAFVVIGNLENETVTAGMFLYSKHNCYYGMSASRRDLFEKPLFMPSYGQLSFTPKNWAVAGSIWSNSSQPNPLTIHPQKKNWVSVNSRRALVERHICFWI